ncbi:histidinol-phosphatase [Acrocarpospora pleiomorpha]|uniref:Histidinol-phosphatase n=1 Tax=Acrocarpospora pleiomorpha TaxID=90975 RepID=A0A5M3XZU1_9ACTN|nr:PHP domain-containing protein [Acrocarpospora pleiomorpha]GES23908.1 histidinol-phosphatase [Acrocarpospora pleiomorpha]
MGHHHHHHDQHEHEHDHAGDLSVPERELEPGELNRRSLMRRAGLLGAAAVAAGATASPAAAATPHHPGREPRHGYQWLAGDHHIHTQYSSDAVYRVIDHVRHANAYGLDWMVITDHGGAAHARIGVEKVNPDIVQAREAYEDVLVFQGLEWNIPAAEHATVFVHPGRNEVAVLKEFENSYDGSVKNANDSTPANEALAVAGIAFLGEQVRRRRIPDALFFANHPARRGVDSPHEIRAWRDSDPSIAVGFEGAPGHQAAGIKAPLGPGSGRGFYSGSPSAASFPAYPVESYRTFGGFDWMTSTVGGLWDSLLAEGKPWWISANSDSHTVYGDTATRGPNSDFEANGRYNDPVYGQPTQVTAGDFWPGFYSRTNVGAEDFSYAAVMRGLRAGRVWVDHGHLIKGLNVRARVAGNRSDSGITLGDTLVVRKGTPVELVIEIDLASEPNWAQFVPVLAQVDVIQGDVTGPAANPDVFTTPSTKVAKSFEVTSGAKGSVRFVYGIGPVDRPIYLRVRGTDGKRSAVGLLGAGVDPAGPQMDVLGDADPWLDLWFYSNPLWVRPRG